MESCSSPNMAIWSVLMRIKNILGGHHQIAKQSRNTSFNGRIYHYVSLLWSWLLKIVIAHWTCSTALVNPANSLNSHSFDYLHCCFWPCHPKMTIMAIVCPVRPPFLLMPGCTAHDATREVFRGFPMNIENCRHVRGYANIYIFPLVKHGLFLSL